MTELEKQLLSALEQLQQDYSKRLDEWENAFAEWGRLRKRNLKYVKAAPRQEPSGKA